MFMKTLLATSALVVASSMAVANTHPVQKPTLKQLEAQHRDHLIAKGIVVNDKGFQLAVHALGHADGNVKNAKVLPPKKGFGTLSDETNALFVSWFGWFAGATAEKSDFSGSFCYSYNASDVCINHYKYKESFSDNIHQSAAQPFTGATKAKGVSVGAAQYSGSGGAEVAIYTDNGGNPGTSLAHGAFSSAPAFTGQCCSSLETVTFKKPLKLTATSQYWVVLSQNGSANGRVAWQGQATNWTSLGGEQYNYTLAEKILETYGTTAHHDYCGSGHNCTYKTTINESSGGWIHTSAYSYSEPSGGFRLD
jgi:hypothetical protein